MNGGPLITLSGDGLYCSLVLKKKKKKRNASSLPMTGGSMPASKQMGCLFFLSKPCLAQDAVSRNGGP